MFLLKRKSRALAAILDLSKRRVGNWKKPFLSSYSICFLIVLLFTTLASCGISVRIRALMGGKLHVSVDIAENANQNHPTAVDLVFVRDKELLAKLLDKPAGKWFKERTQIKRDYTEGKGLYCWSREWSPGQKIPVQVLPLRAGTRGLLVYANYLAPGAHRVRVNPFNDFKIRLLEKKFTLETVD